MANWSSGIYSSAKPAVCRQSVRAEPCRWRVKAHDFGRHGYPHVKGIPFRCDTAPNRRTVRRAVPVDPLRRQRAGREPVEPVSGAPYARYETVFIVQFRGKFKRRPHGKLVENIISVEIGRRNRTGKSIEVHEDGVAITITSRVAPTTKLECVHLHISTGSEQKEWRNDGKIPAHNNLL